MDTYIRIVCSCSYKDCPYKKNHCCLGEININSLNGIVPLKARHCCKVKHSKRVIGILNK